MCLIIAPGEDNKPALLPREVFNYVYSRNKDGFGAMWTEDGRVKHFKSTSLTEDQIYSTMEEYVERHPDVIFHMRYKTHGKIIPGLAHPFRILHKNRHGKDLFFMHNGVFSSFGNNLSYGQSDTTVFKDKILVPLLTRDPDALDDPEVMAALNKLSSGSRLVFMDSEGKVWRTGETTWNKRYGLCLSNNYMLPTETVVSFASSSKSKEYEAKPTNKFIYHRRVYEDGKESSIWCACPKSGFLRGDNGKLYKDNGPGKTLWTTLDYIPEHKEKDFIGDVIGFDPVSPETEKEMVTIGEPLEDDDIPFEWRDDDESKTVGDSEAYSGPAPLDMRLRYARLVHNLIGGRVTSRSQLLADLIGMNDEEMGGFINEDPVNSHTVMAELVEMILEYNDALWAIDPNHEKILSSDLIIEQGATEYHQKAMKELTELRKKEYQARLKEKVEQAHMKVYGPDCKGPECDCHQCTLEKEEAA